MKKINYYVWLVIVLCMLHSCTNADLDLTPGNEPYDDPSFPEANYEQGIDAAKTTISESDALIIAEMFAPDSPTGQTRSGHEKEIKEIIPISENLGEPLMYAINYKNNNGYVIVSTTKNTPAILAYSEQGNFDQSNQQTGMAYYIDEFKDIVKSVQYKKTDGLREKYALSWHNFERHDENVAETRSGANAKRNKEVKKLTNAGYTCQKLTVANLSAFMSEEEAKQTIEKVCNITHPKYDCMSSAILISAKKSISKSLLKTAWHQSAPFNVDAPNEIAGCVTIALAQLMKYHEWPLTYDWSKIAVKPVPNDAFNFFMIDIREKCKAQYYTNGTAIADSDATNALRKAFKYNVKWSNHDAISVRQYHIIKESILNDHPVLMRGATKTEKSSIGHMWIAHGYKEFYTDVKIAFVAKDEKYKYLSVAKEPYNDPYLNMNWGWGTNTDFIHYSHSTPSSRPSSSFSISKKYAIVSINKN